MHQQKLHLIADYVAPIVFITAVVTTLAFLIAWDRAGRRSDPLTKEELSDLYKDHDISGSKAEINKKADNFNLIK